MSHLTRRHVLAGAAATAAVAAMPAAAIAGVETAPTIRTVLHAMRDMDRLLDEERRLLTERWMRRCWINYMQNTDINEETVTSSKTRSGFIQRDT